MRQLAMALRMRPLARGALTAEQRQAIRLAQAGEWGLADAMELDWLNSHDWTVAPHFAGDEDAFPPIDWDLLEQVRACAIRRTDAGLRVLWLGTASGADLRRCAHGEDWRAQTCGQCGGMGYVATLPRADGDVGPAERAASLVVETDIDGHIVAVRGEQ